MENKTRTQRKLERFIRRLEQNKYLTSYDKVIEMNKYLKKTLNKLKK